MENEELLKLGIGEDKPQLQASAVIVDGVRVDEVEINGDKTNKIVLVCKHPESENPIELTGAKYEDRSGKLKVSGLWGKTDSDGKLPFNSAAAHVLRNAKVGSFGELVGNTIMTILDDKGYLVVKAY